MAIYAGETVVFVTSATQVDDANTPLTDADVTSATITIYDSSDSSEVLASTAMVWNATDVKWRYSWTTATAGKFEARLRLAGLTFDTFEYQKVTVIPDKF